MSLGGDDIIVCDFFFFCFVMIKTHTLEQQKADWFNGFSLIVNEVLKVNALFKTSLLIDRSYCADAVKSLLSSDNW